MQDFQVAISQAPLLCLAHRYVLCSLRPPGLQHVKASLSITNFQSLLKLMSIELVHCHPTISSSVPPSPPALYFPASGYFTYINHHLLLVAKVLYIFFM